MRQRRQQRRRGKTNDGDSTNRSVKGTDIIIKNLLLQAAEMIWNDIRKPDSKIKALFNKITPKIIIDDTKEIKNVKYKVLDDDKLDNKDVTK